MADRLLSRKEVFRTALEHVFYHAIFSPSFCNKELKHFILCTYMYAHTDIHIHTYAHMYTYINKTVQGGLFYMIT